MIRLFFPIAAGAMIGLVIAAVPLWRQSIRLAARQETPAAAIPSANSSQKSPPGPHSPAAKTDTPLQMAEKVQHFTAPQCREALDAAVKSGHKDRLSALMCRWAALDGIAAFAWLDEHIELLSLVTPDALSVWAVSDPAGCSRWMENWVALRVGSNPPEGRATSDSGVGFDPVGMLNGPAWRTLLQHDLRAAIRVAGNVCEDSPVGAPISRNDLRPAIRSAADLQAVGAEILAHPEWLVAFNTEKPLYLLVALRECWQEMDPEGWDRWAASHPEAAEKSDNQPVNPGLKLLRSSDRAAAATEALASAPPDELEEISTGIVKLWDDPEATGQWLNAQPDGPVKNAAAQAYALQFAKEDPDAALHWANAITDPASRARTQRRVFTAWHDADPASAAAWLPQSGWGEGQMQAARDIMAAAPPAAR